MSRNSFLLLCLLLIVLLSSAAADHENAFCLPKWPNECACMEVLISEEERAEIENLTVGGVKQQVDGTGAERMDTLQTVMSMALYLRDFRNQYPDIAPKWCG